MNVLIACEESQEVCKAFRARGHRAFSCDIQECSGGHPEWHIRGDVLPLINGDCTFITMDGKEHKQCEEWDILIAHPPCTYLTVSGNRWFDVEKYGNKAIEREREREGISVFYAICKREMRAHSNRESYWCCLYMAQKTRSNYSAVHVWPSVCKSNMLVAKEFATTKANKCGRSRTNTQQRQKRWIFRGIVACH